MVPWCIVSIESYRSLNPLQILNKILFIIALIIQIQKKVLMFHYKDIKSIA